MRFALCSFLFTLSCSASTLVVSTGGTIDEALLPTGSYYAWSLGEVWTLSFTIDSNPAVSFGYGTFDPAFSNLVFTINGSPQSYAQELIVFRGLGAGLGLGGFDVCFDGGACIFGMELEGPQLYSGSASDPTILTGVFDESRVDSLWPVVQQFSYLPITISTVPEPSRLTLIVLTLACGAANPGCRRRLSRQRFRRTNQAHPSPNNRP